MLRMYPTAPVINRVCTQKYIIPNTDVTIEEGTKIFISLLALHNDPQYYTNPEIFIPDRFLESDSFFQNTYLPFGNGPRYCIGIIFINLLHILLYSLFLGDKFALIAVKLGLVCLLEKFSIDIAADSFLTVEKNSIFLMPTGNFKLKFVKD